MQRLTRSRRIKVNRAGHGPCCVCGKATSRRKGKRPAPIHCTIELTQSGNCIMRAGYEIPLRQFYLGSLCMACAKCISSRLDAVIEQIESRYGNENRRD
jgi:hypothetical protein